MIIIKICTDNDDFNEDYCGAIDRILTNMAIDMREKGILKPSYNDRNGNKSAEVLTK